MDIFDVSRILTAQGADKGDMALVLESLFNGNLTPIWRPGETGAKLTPRDVATVLIGSTAANPADAAAHCIAVARLIRADGKALGNILTTIISIEPYNIAVEEITVAANTATIRYVDGTVDSFHAGDGLKPFYRACIIRGSLLQALAIKMQMPTVSGWADPRPEEDQAEEA